MKRSLRLEMRSALMASVGEGLEPQDVLELLRLGEDGALSETDREILRDAAFRWQRDIGDLLCDRRSSDELEHLGAELAEIAAVLDTDLDGPIKKVATELEKCMSRRRRSALTPTKTPGTTIIATTVTPD